MSNLDWTGTANQHKNGFLLPNGEWKACGYGQHFELALELGFKNLDDARQAGCVHFSEGPYMCLRVPTPMQFEWLLLNGFREFAEDAMQCGMSESMTYLQAQMADNGLRKLERTGD